MSASDTTAERTRWPSARLNVRTLSAERWMLLALIALAAVIRIVIINNQSFWADEALTAHEARISFGAMLHTVIHVETTPPLYFVVVWCWAKLFGTSEVALRSVSAIAGVVLVPIAYASARELVSRRAGVLAAAFVAVNPLMVWYSQEARSYMLVATLAGASFLWFTRALRDPSRRNLIWWAACSSAAVMTHFFAGFVVLPEALWLLWTLRTRAVTAAVAVVGIAQAAMLPFALLDANAAHGASWIAKIPVPNRLSMAVIEWGGSNIYRRVTVLQGLLIGAALILVGIAVFVRGSDPRTRAGAKVAGAIVVFAFGAPLVLGSVGVDYFLSRNMIPAFVPVAVLVAAVCVAPRARLLGGTLGAVLLAVFVLLTIDVQTNATLQRADWRAVARSLGPAQQPRAILVSGGDTAQALKIYLSGVQWAQSRDRPVLVSEIDIIGARKHMVLVGPGIRLPSGRVVPRTGSSMPRTIGPPGSTVLTHYKLQSWVVARFQLAKPTLLSPAKLVAIAPRYYVQTPRALLVLTQPRAA
jgi:4-amino-4-deoxy-L-arabinose transferase-like glycosyltransferase